MNYEILVINSDYKNGEGSDIVDLVTKSISLPNDIVLVNLK